jgi:hypothetical protein
MTVSMFMARSISVLFCNNLNIFLRPEQLSRYSDDLEAEWPLF